MDHVCTNLCRSYFMQAHRNINTSMCSPGWCSLTLLSFSYGYIYESIPTCRLSPKYTQVFVQFDLSNLLLWVHLWKPCMLIPTCRLLHKYTHVFVHKSRCILAPQQLWVFRHACTLACDCTPNVYCFWMALSQGTIWFLCTLWLLQGCSDLQVEMSMGSVLKSLSKREIAKC